MIKGDLNRIGDYVAKEPLLATVADFLGERRAGDLEIGKYMIDGDRVYANVQQYVTKSYDEAKYEAHDHYIDVQCIVSGEEAIYLVDREGLEVREPYNSAKDVIFYEDAGETEPIILHDIEFVVIYPHEAHKPGVAPGEKKEVSKIVFKIRVN